MNYNELTRKYFESDANAGELVGSGVFRGAAGDPTQGTWVQFDLQIKAGLVSAARFLAFACPHTIAVAAWLAEQAVGGRLQPALPECVQALRERFAVPIEKMGRLLIVEDAWLAAVLAAIDYGKNTHIVGGSGT
jgi:NifU-like protein involved in Fe-S cluster formation